jgi:hypothetical protein
MVTIAGMFAPQGTSAPTLLAGRGVTVTRTGVGKYKIALTDTTVAGLVAANVSLGMTTPDGSTVTFITTSGAIFDSTNNCVYVQALLDDLADTSASIAAVELDASSGGSDDGSVVSFALHFTKSTLSLT